MTITTEQILMTASVLGALAAIWAVISKPFKAFREINEGLKRMDDRLTRMERTDKLHGDMIYQMLDHMSSNNNSGGMKAALDKYNETIRHEA